MNVVLYLRYSSDKQTEQSIEGQKRVCTAYCERNNMNIVGIYADRALSASKNVEKREQFQLMIKDSEKHRFEAVVVYKLDRFARDRYDSAVYKNKLKKNGVRVISATENITDSPEGIILESVLEGMAEFYSKELAQKVTRGMHETALKGNSCGGYISLGYKIVNKKYVVDPVTAEIVKEAFERYAKGDKVADICEDFNRRGFRTTTGALFNKNSFTKMFKNERYIGVYKYKDVRIEDGIPPIVDRKVFDMVQARLENNNKKGGKGKAKVEYLLSGKIFCGHCGATLNGETGTSKNGAKHHYYSCANKKQHRSCQKKNIRKEWIEQIVVENAYSLLTPEGIEELANVAVKQSKLEYENNELIPAIEAEIKETTKSITNLLKLVEHGSESPSLFNRLDELENKKKSLEAQLAEELETVLILEKEPTKWWLEQFANGDMSDPDFRRRLVNMLINSVTVWDTETEGVFKITTLYNLNYPNTKTIQCSDNSSLVEAWASKSNTSTASS